jgi:hypothetical protein
MSRAQGDLRVQNERSMCIQQGEPAMKRITFVRSSLAFAAVLGIAGCAGQMGQGMMAKPSSVQVYTATLTAAEEVPPATDSQGKGTAEVRVDTATNELTWKVSYSGLTGPATMGHIHGPAGKGQNAGVVVPFPNVAGQTSAEGKAKITQAQYGDLAAGMYYVNIHTAKYPGGEIRGQLQAKR